MSTVLNQLIDNSSNTSGYNLITEEKLEDLKLRCAQEQSRLLKEAMDMRQKRRDNLNHRLNKLLVTIQSDESNLNELKFENPLQSSSNFNANFKSEISNQKIIPIHKFIFEHYMTQTTESPSSRAIFEKKTNFLDLTPKGVPRNSE